MIRRLERLDHLAEKFGQKASIHEAWTDGTSLGRPLLSLLCLPSFCEGDSEITLLNSAGTSPMTADQPGLHGRTRDMGELGPLVSLLSAVKSRQAPEATEGTVSCHTD